MLRFSFWATAFACIAGVSLAAPSADVPARAPQPEQPMLSEDWSLEAYALPVEEVVNADGIQIARKGNRGGKRGGGGRKSRGGFKNGNRRHAGEPGRPGRIGDPGGIRGGELGRVGHAGNRDVDIDRDVNIDRDIDIDGDDWDDDNDMGEAIVGGIIGAGIGSILTNSQY